MGITTDISFPEKGGNIGPLDFQVDIPSPNGLGFVIDAKSVKGGGYLEFGDGEYIGSAELTVLDKFTLKAIGIINTKLPDGQEGYSFLLVIMAEFQPVQLGFGFTLKGVGGLIGLHRSLNLDAIREKVKTDEFDKVLFPSDPLNNIHAIVASLNSILPIKQKRYAFGIMGRLGWGTPELIDIKLGFMFEIPSWKIAIVGIAKSEIKKSDKTLVRIQVSFAATYDPENALFAFDASLHDSKILGLKLEGDAVLRLRGGDEPYFMVSVGGFHPAFTPPKGLGLPQKLERLKLSIKDDNPVIKAEFYFALTSNTIQFGAEASAYYSGWGFTIDGGIGFDALFQVNPLYFDVRVRGWIRIYVWGSSWGLSVEGKITGPYPMTFYLSVTIDLWLCDVTFHIPEFSIGRSAETTLPVVEVLPLLVEALVDARNWQPVIPEHVHLLVSTKSMSMPGGDGQKDEGQALQHLLVHPVGMLSIDQSVVPLGIKIERFGDHRPSDYKKFSFQAFDKSGVEFNQDKLEQFFAPSQFFDMEEEEKFNRKSYEKMPSGIKVSGQNLTTGGKIREKDVEYETSLYDPEREDEIKKGPKIKANEARFLQSVLNNSVANSPLGKVRARKLKDKATSFQLKGEEFVIVDADTLVEYEQKRAGSEAEARQMLDQLIKEKPELEQTLEVVPSYEII